MQKGLVKTRVIMIGSKTKRERGELTATTTTYFDSNATVLGCNLNRETFASCDSFSNA